MDPKRIEDILVNLSGLSVCQHHEPRNTLLGLPEELRLAIFECLQESGPKERCRDLLNLARSHSALTKAALEKLYSETSEQGTVLSAYVGGENYEKFVEYFLKWGDKKVKANADKLRQLTIGADIDELGKFYDFPSRPNLKCLIYPKTSFQSMFAPIWETYFTTSNRELSICRTAPEETSISWNQQSLHYGGNLTPTYRNYHLSSNLPNTQWDLRDSMDTSQFRRGKTRIFCRAGSAMTDLNSLLSLRRSFGNKETQIRSCTKTLLEIIDPHHLRIDQDTMREFLLRASRNGLNDLGGQAPSHLVSNGKPEELFSGEQVIRAFLNTEPLSKVCGSIDTPLMRFWYPDPVNVSHLVEFTYSNLKIDSEQAEHPESMEESKQAKPCEVCGTFEGV